MFSTLLLIHLLSVNKKNMIVDLSPLMRMIQNAQPLLLYCLMQIIKQLFLSIFYKFILLTFESFSTPKVQIAVV